MITVFKYAVPVDDVFDLPLPIGADVLCVQVQRGAPYIWAKVNTDNPTRVHRFRLAGTGHPLDVVSPGGPSVLVGRYIGSFQLHAGDLVFHLFEAI